VKGTKRGKAEYTHGHIYNENMSEIATRGEKEKERVEE
jgi:hypothetical protein